jgi:hypothetical protein
VVYARRHAGRSLSFIVSGKLWRNSLIMQDRETGTLWSHVTGEAIHGVLAGARLEMLASVQATWKEWSARHPETLLLRKRGPVRGSRYEDYARDPSKFGIFRSARAVRRLPGKSIVYGVARAGKAVAIAGSALEGEGLLHRKIGDEAVLFVRGRDGGVRAFRARAGDRELRFRKETATGKLREEATGSLFDAETGRCLEGALAGSLLEEIPVQVAYWFAWSSFYPDSEVVDRAGRPAGD